MFSFKIKNIFKNLRRFSAEIQDVVIIGGGPGGYVAAIKAAQLGLKSTCIEGRSTLGGTCLNVGCIPSKSLLHNSHIYQAARVEYKKRGIKISGLDLDLETMMKHKEKSVKDLTNGIEYLFKKNKVTYIKGWGKIVGSTKINVSLLNGKTTEIQAKNIIIATGSESIPIPGLEIDEIDIVTSTGALEFKEVPKDLLVIGAGVIGLELGSVWKRLGSNVEIVEFVDQILPGLDNEITKLTLKILKKQGIKFTLKTAVKTAIKQNGKILVQMETQDSKNITRNVDKVLVSIGRQPYTSGLGLKEQKIAMDGPRIAIYDNWQSISHPNIYAIGDCVNGAMLAHKAEEEGIAVVENLAGKVGHVNYNAIPDVIYTYPEIARVGKTEEELKQTGIKYNKGVFPMLANSRARTIDESEGMVKILSDIETDRILGCHIIGINAGEMIAEGVIAIEYGASSEDLARTCHAHPTLSEAFKEACMGAYDKAIHY